MQNLLETDNEQALRNLLEDRIVLLDGAMGTMVQALSLSEKDVRGERFADHHKEMSEIFDRNRLRPIAQHSEDREQTQGKPELHRDLSEQESNAEGHQREGPIGKDVLHSVTSSRVASDHDPDEDEHEGQAKEQPHVVLRVKELVHSQI